MIQMEHRAWLDARYPNQPAEIPAAGMIEEAGELLHAFVAQKRIQLYGAETRVKDPLADVFDAVGDCSIYFCSFCNSANWDFSKFTHVHVPASGRAGLAMAVDLVRIAAEFYSTRYVDYAMMYMGTLRAVAAQQEWDLMEVVTTVWRKVRDRCK